jgi:Protein of unknown function (DUF4242)
MPLFMDAHRDVKDLSAQAVADAHKQDVEVQEDHGVTYHKYWFNEEQGLVHCSLRLLTRKLQRPSIARPTA